MHEYDRHKTKIDIEIQREISPYAKLFWGEKVLLSEIKEKAPHCLPALETLIRDGRVVIDSVVKDSTDVVLCSPIAVKAKESGLIKRNTTPY